MFGDTESAGDCFSRLNFPLVPLAICKSQGVTQKASIAR
jgi:hypothetical protein